MQRPAPPHPRRLAAALALAGLTSVAASGQLAFGEPALTIPTSGSVSVCDPQPDGYYDLNWKTTRDIPDGEFVIDLPEGIAYLAGSRDTLNGSGIPAGYPNVGVVALGRELRFELRAPLTRGARGTIRFKLNYDCELNETFESAVTLPVTAISATDTFRTISPAINSSAALPIVLLEATPGTRVEDAVRDQPYSRNFEITQTGKQARAVGFELCVDYGSGLAVANQTLEGVPLAFGAGGGCIEVSQVTYPSLPWPMTEDETWTFAEDVTPLSCDSIGTTASVTFGCSGTDCQAPFAIPVELELVDDAPEVEFLSLDRTVPTAGCTDDGASWVGRWRVSGRLYDAGLLIASTAQHTFVDTTSIEVDWGGGTYVPYTGPFRGGDVWQLSQTCAGEYDRVFLSQAPVMDYTGGSRVIRVRYRTRTCCGDSSFRSYDQDGIYGSTARFRYYDKCGEFAQRGRNQLALYLAVDAAADVPAFIEDGAVETVGLDFTTYRMPSELAPHVQVCYEFEVDPALQVIVGNQARHLSGDVGAPVRNQSITPLGGNRYEVCIGHSAFYQSGSRIEFDVRYSCTGAATCGREALITSSVGVRFGRASCGAAGRCTLVRARDTSAVVLSDACCSTPCVGALNLGTDVERVCYGRPDNNNDGTAEASGSINMSRVKTRRAMEGDAMTFTSRARVQTILPADVVEHLTLDLNFPTAHGIAPTAEVTVFDASAGATYGPVTVTSATPDTATARYRVDAADLRGQAGIPATFAFGDGDEVTVVGEYTVLRNLGCGMFPINVEADWFVSPTAGGLPAVGQRCNQPVPFVYFHVGYEYILSPRVRDPYGCSGSFARYQYLFCIGGSTAGSRPFPYEIREFGQPDTFAVEIPPGTTVDSVAVRFSQFTVSYTHTRLRPNVDVTPYAVVAGGYVNVPMADLVANEGFADPNGGYRISIDYYFEGSCLAEPYAPEFLVRSSHAVCGGTYSPYTAAKVDPSRPTEVAKPLLDLTSTGAYIEPHDNLARWNLTLTERGAATAPATWVAFDSPAGSITPLEVYVDGALVTPVNGIYLLGELAASRIRQLRVVADYASCELDSLVAYAGWDCSGYPASAADVVAGAIACAPETLTLTSRPQRAELQQIVRSQPVGPSTPCSNLAYEVQLANVANAVVYEPYFVITGPSSEGIDLIASTGFIAYPATSNPAPADYVYPIGSPDRVESGPEGPRYLWDLDRILPQFDKATGQGWEGQLTSDSLRRRIALTFEARTNCFFDLGDYLAFDTEGFTHCGDTAATLTNAGNAIILNGASPPYPGYLSFDADRALDPCTNAGVETFTGSVLFERTTDGSDTLVLRLPPTMRLDAFAAGEPNTFDVGAIGTRLVAEPGGNVQEVRVPILAGIFAYERSPYTLDVLVDPPDAGCGVTSEVTAFTTHYTAYACASAVPPVCERHDTTGVLAPTRTFTFVLDTVALGRVGATTDCDQTAVTLDDVELVNPTARAISADVELSVYVDEDLSGDVSPGDVLLGTHTHSGGVPAASTVTVATGPFPVTPDQLCRVIVAAAGCTCDTAAAPLTTLASENAGPDAAACAPDPVAVGCGTDNSALGYTYAWAPVGAAPAGLIASPAGATTQILAPANDDAVDVYTYRLTTTLPGGCLSFTDDVTVTFTGVETADGPPVSGCAGAAASLSGPSGFTDYRWSPSTGVADSTDPASAVVLPADTTTYVLTYRKPDGCVAAFTQVAVGRACPDLELAKVVAAPAAAVGDELVFAITLTNAGTGDATGVTVGDALPAQLAYASSVATSGTYDPTAGVWTLTGPLPGGSSATLELRTTVVAGGWIGNVAEVLTQNEPELDSSPGNGDPDEDDTDGACATVPLAVACDDPPVTLETYPGFATYQWLRDGAPVPGATARTYRPDVSGAYAVVIDGGAAAFAHDCVADVVVDVCAALGDRVWLDADADGLQDPGEPGVAGVTVVLRDAGSGAAVDTQRTDADGAYLFPRIAAGDYRVAFDWATAGAPYRFQFSPRDIGPDEAADSDPDPATGVTAVVTTGGTDNRDVDAGLVPVDEIELGPLDLTVGCELDAFTVDRFAVRNVGGKPVTDALTVDFVVDTDGDGMASPGEVVVGSTVVTDDIPVGDSVIVSAGPFAAAPVDICRVIAVAYGCVCEPATAGVARIRTRNAGDDQAGCAPDALPIGCSPDVRPDGFTFAWSALDPAADALLADPSSPTTTVAPPADPYVATTMAFVLTTTYPQGCQSRDTVAVTFAAVDAETGPELTDCAGATATLTGPTGFSEYAWTPALGLADPTDPRATVTIPEGRTEYVLRYRDASGCTAEYRQTIRGVSCVDLRLDKAVRDVPAAVGATVSFALTLTNEGLGEATGIVVTDVLDGAFAFERAQPAGQYDPTSGRWSVPGALAPGASAELVIYATVTRGGLLTNVAEVVTADQPDVDSEYGNGRIDEDDMDAVCLGVDLEVACNTAPPTLRTFPGLGRYQWYRDGILLPGASGSEVVAEETGRYTVEIEGGQSGYPDACDVAVAFERCGDVGDRVWLDVDGDGVQDAGEPGLPGVGVRLYDARTDTLVRAVATGSDGTYLFRNILAGAYYVVFDDTSEPYDVPFRFSPRNRGGDDALDSDPDADGRTGAFLLTAAEPSRDDIDAGLTLDADIAAVKRTISFENLRSGNLVIEFEIGVANLAATPLTDVTLADGVARWFGAGFVRVARAPQAFGGPGIQANPRFDGASDTLLLAPGAVLPAGGEIVVTFAVEVDPEAATWPLYNQARARGTVVLGEGLPSFERVDLSDSGFDYEGTNPGEPGDRGTADDPTEVDCGRLDIRLEGDGAVACLGERVTIRAPRDYPGYAFEWRGPAGPGDTAATRVLDGGGPRLWVTPTQEVNVYAVRLYNTGSDECYYGTEAEATVEVILPPQVITPNNDGANDAFRIRCLGDRRGARITIYNRWGSSVYRSDDYANDWEGTYLGRPLPVGTYFYVLELPEGSEAPAYKGVIAVER